MLLVFTLAIFPMSCKKNIAEKILEKKVLKHFQVMRWQEL